MSYTGSRRAVPEPMGAAPALLLAALAVMLLAALLALLVPSALRPDPLAKATARTAAATPLAQVVPAGAPAIEVVAAVVDTDPVWSATLPLPFGCQGPDPVLAATGSHGPVLIGAFVMPAGAGQQAMDALRGCGSPTTVAGAPARHFGVDGGRVVVWSRGDVLVSVSAPTLDDAVLAATDDRLTTALRGVCASTDPKAQDPTRNPVLAGYKPWRVRKQVAVVPSGLDVGEADAVATPTELDVPTLPEGVAGPPLPQALTAPQRPTHPGEQPLTRSYWQPVVDETGPGCGWAFTGATGPRVDPEAVQAAAIAAAQEAQAELDAEHAAWARAAGDYLQALPAYQEDLTAWEAYVVAVGEVAEQWDAQAKALETYEAAVALRESQLLAREKFDADKAAAKADHEAAELACQDWQEQVEEAARRALAPDPSADPTADPTGDPTTDPSAEPTSTPTADPTPTLPQPPAGGCPAPRPAILDEAAPVVAPEPAPPALWEREG